MGLNKNSTTIRINNDTCKRINKRVNRDRYSWDVKINLILDELDKLTEMQTNKQV